MQKQINIKDNDLFPNEAGEDESPDILDSYFVDKDIFQDFRSSDIPFAIVRAKKGIGKSALLRKIWYEKNKTNDISIYVSSEDFVPTVASKPDNAIEYISEWKRRICSFLTKELGAKIKIAFADDKIALVEEAELAGFRERNLLGALIDRIVVKTKDLEIAREKPKIKDHLRLLKRYKAENKDSKIWLFIDNIDATFKNKEDEILRIGTFLSACRHIVREVKDLNIRVSIRTDVWTIIDRKDEALTHVLQYIKDLKWSEEETSKILASWISSYKHRHGIDAIEKSTSNWKAQNVIINEVFDGPFLWGGKDNYPAITVHTLSHGRPRWAAQLCKSAAKSAIRGKSNKIRLSDIESNLSDYGKLRINDLVKEHVHQCADIEDIIYSFSRQMSRYATDELIKTISKRISDHITATIDGTKANDKDIAAFLYRIGFIQARQDYTDKSYKHYNFEDMPDLLVSRVDIDRGMTWEVHPCFRTTLDLSRNPRFAKDKEE